jgi:hypothetical protein
MSLGSVCYGLLRSKKQKSAYYTLVYFEWKTKQQTLYIKKNRAKEQNWQRRGEKDEKKTRENDW